MFEIRCIQWGGSYVDNRNINKYVLVVNISAEYSGKAQRNIIAY